VSGRHTIKGVTDIAADRARLLEIVKDKAIVHGKVTLSSGKEADYYVDLRRITLDGEASPLVGKVMRDLTKDLEFDAVGGLTLGADDTSTTGASPLDAAKAAQEAGATVVAVATIADRATGADKVFADHGLEYRHVYGLTDLGLA
jgi:orotate phosphoribosyltransferase